jgi:hydroxymethylpyrimidine pyrophosphatase-like HAD family hydrolase
VTSVREAGADPDRLLRLRLIAADLDNTLVVDNGPLTDRCARAVRAAGSAGLSVVIVTGRAPYHLAEFGGLPLVGTTALCSNGAATLDAASQRVVRWDGFRPEQVATIAERLLAWAPSCRFGIERADCFAREPSYRPDRIDPRERVLPLSDLLRMPALKLLVQRPGWDKAALAAWCRTVLGATGSVSYGRYGDFVEVSPPGVDKGVAVARHARLRGVPRSAVVALGDMPNDLPMLRWAGLSVAVADAHPDVLAAADVVVPPAAEDGVAGFLEALVCVARRSTG